MAHLVPVAEGSQLSLLVHQTLLQLQHTPSFLYQLLSKGAQKCRVVICCCPEASVVVLQCQEGALQPGHLFTCSSRTGANTGCSCLQLLVWCCTITITCTHR